MGKDSVIETYLYFYFVQSGEMRVGFLFLTKGDEIFG